jgi:phage major head subunit gpT-like protein
MKKLNFTAAIELNAAENAPKTGQKRFKILAYSGGLLNVEGFPYPVIIDLAGLVSDHQIPILLDHKKTVETTLGLTDSIANDGKSLVISGLVTGQSEICKQVIAQAAAGHTWQASIGALVTDSIEIEPGQSVEVNGQSFTGPCIVARSASLRETSVLPVGADSTTSVNLAAAAAMKGNYMPSFEEWLESLGIAAANLSDENRAVLSMAYDTATAKPTPAAATMDGMPAGEKPKEEPPMAAGAMMNLKAALAAQNREIAANLRRVAEIQAAAAGNPTIAATAIEQNWSTDRVKLEMLQASLAKTRPTSFRAAESNLDQATVLEAAICMTRKTREVEKDFTPAILQAAHSQFRRGIGLKQMLLQAASANGYHANAGEGIHTGNLRDVLRFACPSGQELQATGFSTVSVPNILSNVANKELLTGYMEEDSAWREIAAVKSVSDFKQATSYRLLDDMTYEQLSPAGEIRHGGVGEETYTRQVDTYAKMFAITRTMIINDDMGAFDDLRARIGRGSAKKLNQVFWTEFTNNSSFFTTGNTNYLTGATSNLGSDGVGLGLAVLKFRQMTSPTADGKKRVNADTANPVGRTGTGGRPEILLVPPELEAIAEALYRNQNLGMTKTSESNIYAGKYRPVVAWQLSDSTYTGYSTTAFYLLNSPGYLPTTVVSFLNGVETPTVESADADFSTLGIQFRGYHDFGVDQAEYLGGVKSKGAA